MSLVGFLLASTLPFVKSSTDILSKEGLDKDIDPITVTLFYRLFGIPITIVGVLLFGGIPTLTNEFWYALSITVPISVIATFLYVKALEVSDVSLISPLSAISPAILLLTGFLILGEVPSIIGVLGILILLFGLYIMQISKQMEVWYQPIKNLLSDKGAQIVFLQIILYSISAPLDKVGVQASSPVFYTFSVYFGLCVLFLPIYLYYYTTEQTTTITKSDLKMIAPIGFLNGVASLIQMTAISMILVVYVISLKRLGVLISTLYGVFVKDEGFGRTRIIGVIFVIFALLIISFDISV